MVDTVNIIKPKYSKTFYIAKASVLAIFPFVLLLLPVTTFDNGRDVCLFTILSGYHCWGCGMTRACMHLIHLDLAGALSYNKLAFIVLPILCFLLVKDFLDTLSKIRYFSNPQPISGNDDAQDADR